MAPEFGDKHAFFKAFRIGRRAFEKTPWTSIEPNEPPTAEDVQAMVQADGIDAQIQLTVTDNYPVDDELTVTVKTLPGDIQGQVQTVPGETYLLYTPPAAWQTSGGTETFTIEVADNFGEKDEAVVTITVNAPPTFSLNPPLEVTGGSEAGDWAFRLQPVEVSDPDGDSTQVTFTAFTDDGDIFFTLPPALATRADSFLPVFFFAPTQATLDDGTASFLFVAEDENGGAAQIEVDIVIDTVDSGGPGGERPLVLVNPETRGQTNVPLDQFTTFMLTLSDDMDNPEELRVKLALAPADGSVRLGGVRVPEDGWMIAGSSMPDLTYEPGTLAGDYPFDLVVADSDGNTRTVDFTVTVVAASGSPLSPTDVPNTAPVFAAMDTVQIEPWQVLQRLPVAVPLVNSGGDIAVSDDFTLVQDLTLNLSGETGGTATVQSGPNPTVYFTPNADFSAGSFQISATDGHGATSPPVTVSLALGGEQAKPMRLALKKGWNFFTFQYKPANGELARIKDVVDGSAGNGNGVIIWEWLPDGTLYKAVGDLKADVSYSVFVPEARDPFNVLLELPPAE